MALFALGFLPALQAAEESDRPLPTVLIVATGGTISAVQDDPEDPTRYSAGKLSAGQIVESVPELAEHAQIELLQFSNMPSGHIKPADWVRLSRKISEQLTTRNELAGVVVTHGTDRMEETAFFLHLTVASDKPVVLVGAQRPATHVSADGPANLLAAVRTAAAPQSRDRGVLVVMDERILSAREVRKDFPRMGGFSTGRIGVVARDGPFYLYRPSRPHTHRADFPLPDDLEIPIVDLVFAYSGGPGPRYESNPAGMVFTASGTTCDEMLTYRALAREGVAVVEAFPTGQAIRSLQPIEESAPQRDRDACSALAGDPRWEGAWIPPIQAPMLTPQKARILLMLALGKTRDRDALAALMQRY